MKISYQRLFCAVVKSAQTSNIFREAINVKCAQGHLNFELIVKCSFNCLIRNELKRPNSGGQKDPLVTMSRKVRKLTSN